MVARYVILLFLLIAGHLHAEGLNVNLPAKVSVEIPPNTALTDRPVPVFITIIRLAWQKVDESSFLLGEEALKVTFVDNQYPSLTQDSQSLVVSRYRFTLPPAGAGLYSLPNVSALVGGDRATSPSISYRIISPQQSDELSLTAGIVEKGLIYPGQKVNLEYQIAFRRPIQLVQENLPLLRMQGFRNIGAPQITGKREGPNTVQVITQTAIAPEPGEYHTGQSMIQGYVYVEDASGNKSYTSSLLEAVVPDTVISVSPFPRAGRPLSFNGAIGVFHWRVKLLGNTFVTVGERLQLEVLVTGSGDLDTVVLPDLTLQKDFKNNFRLSDLAKVGQIEEGTKRFVVELRPVSPSVKQISAIQFSSFDPVSKTYVVQESDPIAITVRPGSQQDVQAVAAPPAVRINESGVNPIEIQGNRMLQDSQLRTRHIETILIAYALIFLVAIIVAQIAIKRIVYGKKKKNLASDALFLEAIQQKSDPNECCRLLGQALLLKLHEVGMTKDLTSHPEQLAADGIQGEISKFLISIEEKRFTGLGTQVEIKDIIDEASQLYYQLKKSNV